jgi:hypothetical protein
LKVGNSPLQDELGLTTGIIRITADGNASYGYGQFLARYGADRDDLLLITFRLTEEKATLRLISDEEFEQL